MATKKTKALPDLTNKELEAALRDPWKFCLAEINRRKLTSLALSEGTGISRSTCRALYNGRSSIPTFNAAIKILNWLLDTRMDTIKTLPPKNAGRMPQPANPPMIPGFLS